MEEETEEQLRARLAAKKQELEQEKARTGELLGVVGRASVRQSLRDEIRKEEAKIRSQKKINDYHASFAHLVDTDVTERRWHSPGYAGIEADRSLEEATSEDTETIQGERLDCVLGVISRELRPAPTVGSPGFHSSPSAAQCKPSIAGCNSSAARHNRSRWRC